MIGENLKKANISYYEILESAKETIELEYKDELRLEDLASKYNLSKFHFHRLFKSYFKVTPKEYFERLKMERAAHLLKYTNATIIDIAFEFGFNNHETFSRAFKRYFGSNPKHYRRNEYQEKTHKNRGYVKDSDQEDIEIAGPVVQFINEINVAYIRHIGDYKRVNKTWIKLVKLGLIYDILNKDTKLLGIYYDDPDITQENHLRFDACFEI